MSIKKVFFVFLFMKVMSGRLKGIVLFIIIIIVFVVVVVVVVAPLMRIIK